MKKEKMTPVDKARKKIIKLAIEESLLQKVKETLLHLGYEPKLAKKEIAKSVKLIARKVTSKNKVLALEKPEKADKTEQASSARLVKPEGEAWVTLEPKEVGKRGGLRDPKKASPKLANVDPVELAESTLKASDDRNDSSQRINVEITPG